jgi:hypothetical protein
MRDMFRPMALIRTGPSYTMIEGRGWMAMFGISLPIWRDKLHAAWRRRRPCARCPKRTASHDSND